MKDCKEEQLAELAENALTQIKERQYHVEMESLGVKEILKYGIAFSGKDVYIRAESGAISDANIS